MPPLHLTMLQVDSSPAAIQDAIVTTRILIQTHTGVCIEPGKFFIEFSDEVETSQAIAERMNLMFLYIF